MDGFRYKYGDRPLEGYTIQRAVGRGGFGEVYFAVSDAGREVALKVIQSHEQIELRGVSACMNLKSPHLVTIFDVRHNGEGIPFVIMEYVSGPSLHELLNNSPSGLGLQKAAFFLREIAKGLTYLHDRGVVHRDLKPGNIFYEDGYVKIGDYGLSKALSTGKQSDQTITVGTVHYMAPEIGQGKYDTSIDVYALGCVLYEMLTGQTPFLGGSHGEILMKHLMDQPDLKDIEEPFATVIRKAMAKDPAERYHTAQEMVEAVFGTEHIRNSVSHFSPESLSVVADRVARTVTVGAGSSAEAHRLGSAGAKPGRVSNEPWDRVSDRLQEVGRRLDQVSERVSDKLQRVGERIAGRMSAREQRAPAIPQPACDVDVSRDPLTWNQRQLLAIMAALFISVGAGFLTASSMPSSGPRWAILSLMSFMLITSAAEGIQSAKRRFGAVLENEPLLNRFVYGMMGLAYAACLLFAAAIPYLMVKGGGRSKIAFAFIFIVLTPCVFFGFMVLSGLVRKGLAGARNAVGEAMYRIPTGGAAIGLGVLAALTNNSLIMLDTLLSCGIPLFLVNWKRLTAPDRFSRVSLRPAIVAGVYGFIAGEVLGGMGIVAAGVLAGVTLVSQIISPFDPQAKRSSVSKRAGFNDAEESADRKIGRSGEVEKVGTSQTQERKDIPKHDRVDRVNADHAPSATLNQCSDRLRGSALLMACVSFVFPVAGLHRFYSGKIVTGILWLCTLGFMHLGTVFDIVCIVTGVFRDRQGRPLLAWWSLNELVGIAQPVQMTLKVPAAKPVFRQRSRSVGNVVLAMTGFILLLTGCVVGFASAIRFPEILAAGWPDPHVAKEMRELFGYDGWPDLLERLSKTMFWLLTAMGSLLVILARRSDGVIHVFRAILGIAAMLFSGVVFYSGLARVNWSNIINMFNNRHAGPAIETFLDSLHAPAMMWALMAAMIAMALLAWPSRSRRATSLTADEREVSS